MHSRLRIILLLTIGTTLCAGYVGLVFFPSMLVVWLGTVLLFPSLAAIVVPVLVGAQIAWPVTCVGLPLAALIFRPATVWTPLLLSIVGAGSALISGKLLPRVMGYGSGDDLLLTCVLSGTLLGALFGYAMWRFDRLSIGGVEAAEGLRTTASASRPGITLAVIFIAFALTYLVFSSPNGQSPLDSNAMKDCTENGQKLLPRKDGAALRVTILTRNNKRAASVYANKVDPRLVGYLERRLALGRSVWQCPSTWPDRKLSEPRADFVHRSLQKQDNSP